MSRFCFLYNKTGANSEEWFEISTGDKAYKRTAVHGGRAGGHGFRGRGKSGGRSQPRDPGFIYIITMHGRAYESTAPHFAKVGYTHDCRERIRNLQAGNPFQLFCSQNWPVPNKKTAEQNAHQALNNEGLDVDMDGGTEWFYYGSLGLNQFAYIVWNAFQTNTSRDLVESSINPSPHPNQAGAIMATNYGNLNPRLAGVYNQRWRQALQRNVLKIKYCWFSVSRHSK